MLKIVTSRSTACQQRIRLASLRQVWQDNFNCKMTKTSGVKMIHWLLFDEVLLGFLSKPNSPLGRTSSKSIYLIASNFKIKLETKINQFKNCPQGKLNKCPFNYINDQIIDRRKHLTSTGKGFHRSSIFFSVTTVVVKKIYSHLC